MPKFDPTKPRSDVTFLCRDCRRTFDAEPARVENAPDRTEHPFEYFGTCPGCKREAPQAFFDRNLQRAWLNATGPKSPEGKAASAANGKGHPTPEEALRTRFNAMKTGAHAKVATYFPARPGGYGFCQSCEVDRDYCGQQSACVKQTEIFMLHHAAFDQRDPAKLKGLYGDLHAAVFSVLQQIVQTIIADGVKIVSPEYYTDKEGVMILARYVDGEGEEKQLYNLEAHPLFRPLGELISRLNLSLADMGMTVKVVDQSQDADMGQLAGHADREAIEDFKRRTEHQLGLLEAKISRGHAARARDPILLEHDKETGVAVPVER